MLCSVYPRYSHTRQATLTTLLPGLERGVVEGVELLWEGVAAFEGAWAYQETTVGCSWVLQETT